MEPTDDAHKLRQMTVDDLYSQMAACQSPGWYQMAVEELQRRYLLEVGRQVEALDTVTGNMHRDVTLLASSSEKVERLTKTLRNLTWALIGLTLVQIGIAVMGILRTG
ncbi:MAG: hypothetical protein V2A79_18445 [Planctomycetota bacterium]